MSERERIVERTTEHYKLYHDVTTQCSLLEVPRLYDNSAL